MATSWWKAGLVAWVVLIAPRGSSAQPADAQAIAAAQKLGDDASQLMNIGKYAEACPKLEQATQLVPEAIGAKLALAGCYEKMGRLASAQGQYLQAEALARSNKDRRADGAAKKAADLKSKLAMMTLDVPAALRDIEGLSLTWDGRELGKAIWGTSIPVDVGKHVIEVKAPGWKAWKDEVTIEANGRSVTQTVPLLEKLPEEKPKVMSVIREPGAEIRTWRTPLFFTAMGVGVVGLGMGVGFTLGGSAKNNEANALIEEIRFDRNMSEPACPPTTTDTRCADVEGLRSSRDAFATVGVAGFVIGGVGAVGALVVALMARSKPSAKKDAMFVVPSKQGVLVTGTF